MRVRVITPPDPLVSWEEANAHLKLDGDEGEKDLVEAMIAAASGHIDGVGGWLGRAIGVQTLEARGEAFWPPDYRLPYPPHIDVLSINYVDQGGIQQTLGAELYELDDREVLPIYGTSWPTPRSSRGAVKLRYRAGYVVNAEADPLVAAVPAPIKAAVLLMVGDLYRFRETAVSGTIAANIPMSTTVEHLLTPYRVYA